MMRLEVPASHMGRKELEERVSDVEGESFVVSLDRVMRAVNGTGVAMGEMGQVHVGSASWKDVWPVGAMFEMATGTAVHAVSTVTTGQSQSALVAESVHVELSTAQVGYTYSEAVSQCESKGMTMASVHSQGDLDVIHAKIEAVFMGSSLGYDQRRAWLGAEPTGIHGVNQAWRWRDGTVWDWNAPNFASKESSSSDRRLVMSSDSSDKKWEDRYMSERVGGVVCVGPALLTALEVAEKNREISIEVDAAGSHKSATVVSVVVVNRTTALRLMTPEIIPPSVNRVEGGYRGWQHTEHELRRT